MACTLVLVGSERREGIERRNRAQNARGTEQEDGGKVENTNT